MSYLFFWYSFVAARLKSLIIYWIKHESGYRNSRRR